MRYVEKLINEALCLFERISLIHSDFYKFLHNLEKIPPSLTEIYDVHYGEKPIVKEKHLEKTLLCAEKLYVYHKTYFRNVFKKMINRSYTKYTIASFKTAAYLASNAEYELQKILKFKNIVRKLNDPNIISWNYFCVRIPKIVTAIKQQCDAIATEFSLDIAERTRDESASLDFWEDRVKEIEEVSFKWARIIERNKMMW